jgi:hypothetical protein
MYICCTRFLVINFFMIKNDYRNNTGHNSDSNESLKNLLTKQCVCVLIAPHYSLKSAFSIELFDTMNLLTVLGLSKKSGDIPFWVSSCFWYISKSEWYNSGCNFAYISSKYRPIFC